MVAGDEAARGTSGSDAAVEAESDIRGRGSVVTVVLDAIVLVGILTG